MRQLLSIAMAAVVSIGLSGCSSGTGMGATGASCENCNYGYVPVHKGSGRHAWCIKDGKALDCAKNPPECPDCAGKVAQSK
jgi:hypothetical protein